MERVVYVFCLVCVVEFDVYTFVMLLKALLLLLCCCFCFQAEDGIRDLVRSRGLGDVYKRQQHG